MCFSKSLPDYNSEESLVEATVFEVCVMYSRKGSMLMLFNNDVSSTCLKRLFFNMKERQAMEVKRNSEALSCKHCWKSNEYYTT